MESSFLDALAFLGRQTWLSLVVLVVSTAIPMLGALPRRRMLAGAPGLVSIGVFLLSCSLAEERASGAIGMLAHVPVVGLFLAIALVAPSVASLRWREMGWIHVLTVLCGLHLYLVCGLYLSGDAM